MLAGLVYVVVCLLRARYIIVLCIVLDGECLLVPPEKGAAGDLSIGVQPAYVLPATLQTHKFIQSSIGRVPRYQVPT